MKSPAVGNYYGATLEGNPGVSYLFQIVWQTDKPRRRYLAVKCNWSNGNPLMECSSMGFFTARGTQVGVVLGDAFTLTGGPLVNFRTGKGYHQSPCPTG